MRAIILILTLSLTPALAYAKATSVTDPVKAAQGNNKPAPEEVRRVLNYYLHGKGSGPVLIETKICQDIIASGEDKNECDGDVAMQSIRRGQSVYLWMAYMVPLGDDIQNVVIQFDKGGVTRKVENLQVSSQLRNRSWIKVSFDTAGQWQLKVVRDTGEGVESLGTYEVLVK